MIHPSECHHSALQPLPLNQSRMVPPTSTRGNALLSAVPAACCPQMVSLPPFDDGAGEEGESFFFGAAPLIINKPAAFHTTSLSHQQQRRSAVLTIAERKNRLLAIDGRVSKSRCQNVVAAPNMMSSRPCLSSQETRAVPLAPPVAPPGQPPKSAPDVSRSAPDVSAPRPKCSPMVNRYLATLEKKLTFLSVAARPQLPLVAAAAAADTNNLHSQRELTLSWLQRVWRMVGAITRGVAEDHLRCLSSLKDAEGAMQTLQGITHAPPTMAPEDTRCKRSRSGSRCSQDTRRSTHPPYMVEFPAANRALQGQKTRHAAAGSTLSQQLSHAIDSLTVVE